MDLVLLIKSRSAFSPPVEQGEVPRATSFLLCLGSVAFWGIEAVSPRTPSISVQSLLSKSLVSLFGVHQSGSTSIFLLKKGFILTIMDRYSFPCSPSPSILWIGVGLNWKAFKGWSLVFQHGLSVSPVGGAGDRMRQGTMQR